MQPLVPAVEASESATECAAFDALCQTGLPVVGDRIREMFLTMAAGVLEWVAAWWSEVPSLSMTDGFGSQMRAYAVALSVALLVLGLVIQAGRMVWMRRAAPLVDAVTGLSTYVVVVALAVPVTAGALAAGDALSAGVLAGDVDQQVAAQVVAELAATPHTGVVVLLGLLASLAGVGLAAVMMLREVSVLLLAATLPVAAAGRLVPGIGNWLPSVIRWVVALVLWKPAAALMYAAGQRLMVPDEPRSLLVGVVTIGLTVAALPALARWLTPIAQTASRDLLGATSVVTSAGGFRVVARGPTLQQQVARIEREFGTGTARPFSPVGAGGTGRGTAGALALGMAATDGEPEAGTEGGDAAASVGREPGRDGGGEPGADVLVGGGHRVGAPGGRTGGSDRPTSRWNGNGRPEGMG